MAKHLLWLTGFFWLQAHGTDLPEPKMLPPEKGAPLPDNTQILAKKAAEAFSQKEWDVARKAYQEILSLDSKNALVWANLGAVEQQAGKIQEAIAAFESSVKLQPDLATSWSALGLLRAESGDTYLAISMFTRAIHEDPLDARPHNYLAITCRALTWHATAESELLRAIELKPDYGIAHFNLALLYADQKPPSLELAKRHYKKARELGVLKDELLEERLNEAP